MNHHDIVPVSRVQTPLSEILRPLQEFIQHSASGGIVLIATTLVALVLANTALATSYHDLLHTEISLAAGGFELRYSLLHWINDGLMAIFFLLVGLELKREVMVGELSNLRAALLPIVAALGGAVVPAIIYALLNAGGRGAPGWGIPMATDIAFTLGLLALLGKRVPFTLKIFLTAVAIVDDLIAIVVIAVFYSSGIDFAALTLGLVVLVVMLSANIFGVRTLKIYMLLGVIVWVAFLQSGVHATIAGVLIALTIPARNRIDPLPFLEHARALLDRFADSRLEATPMMTDEFQRSVVAQLEKVCEDVQTPLQRLEHSLHPWVSFLIMPVFALANAGVTLSLNSLDPQTFGVAAGIVAGLVVGKPIGLLGAAWLMIRSGAASLPQDVRWSHLFGAACLAGVGFTMSLFLASLSFGDSQLLEVSKLGVLTASLIAAGLGFFLLRRLSPSA